MKRTRALLTTALPAALVAALALTGCSGGNDFGDETDGGTSAQECTPSGAASDAVQLSGDFGEDVKLDSKTPVVAETLERTVAIAGEGEALATGATASVNLTFINGKTGEELSPTSAQRVVNDPEQILPWALQALSCSNIGDRIVTVAPASEMFGEGGGAQADMEDADAVITVIDLLGLAKTRAEGKAVDAPAGFPTVTLAEDGAPTVTMPTDVEAPTKLQIATLIEGDGEVVKDGDSVTSHYIGAIWRTGEVFNSSWEMGSPATFTAAYPGGVIEGFYEALVGQKVGSQVIAIVPASAGYGDDTASQLSGTGVDVKNDDVLVFVVDILDTAHAG
ncbi:FKBP-type peptidyl-prolyl cis-trans isomerase [Leucobacter soli]|uniref:peptidylprolyl isomerase n=1 Tax=Leucobacter soli TaxID=2812850 RepID=A0A916JWZ0_9MICO|nr:FKBP-type peptidyl-prolyl cis-trans isomerase [Leucobacter soli]CAG7611381.1 hypothetical protein LEUCIP111803_01427 [Leucobacter soli]